ncbi:MAG: hypothetical protein ACXAC7_09510 [Candidatus Hodarchaeales archaeon]
MIIYAVHILSNSGIMLLSEFFQSKKSVPDVFLLGGLLTALQGVATEITSSPSEMNSFEVGGISYHIQSFAFFRIVVVTNFAESPIEIIQSLGLRFIKDYRDELVEENTNLKTYSPFIKTIREVVKEKSTIDETRTLNPTKILDTAEIFELPQELHSTALAVLTLEEGTVEQIAKEIGEQEDITTNNLVSLQKYGFIGKKIIDQNIIYFCS